jgi:hypothetical protein
MSDITQHIDFLSRKKGNQEKEKSSKGTKQEKRKRRDKPH